MAERSPVNPTCSDETRSTAPVKQEEKQDGLNEPERQAEDLGTPNNDCQGADVESTADPAQAREGLSAITVPADQAPDVVASHHQALVNAVLAVNPQSLSESIEMWKKAIADEASLQRYAVAMETNARHKWLNHKGKFLWILTRLDEYYFGKGLVYSRLKDEKRSHFAEKEEQMGADLIAERTASLAAESASMTEAGVRLLDVGSCYDPIREILNAGTEGPKFPLNVEITAVDLCPTVSHVYKCDFLTIPTSPTAPPPPCEAKDQKLPGGEPLAALPETHYHAVVFSLLLEYLPTPEQRLLCVEKARELLTDHGVLFVITPKSTAKKNSAHKIKEWKTVIESAGFTRWRYDVQLHVHCMAFRKIDSATERQWVGKIAARKADIPVSDVNLLGVPRDRIHCQGRPKEDGQQPGHES